MSPLSKPPSIADARRHLALPAGALGVPGRALLVLLAACLCWAQPGHAANDQPGSAHAKAKPAKTSSRVAALRKALADCEQKGNYFSREACRDKSRWKYCGAPFSHEPLWGKVPECPNSAQQTTTP